MAGKAGDTGSPCEEGAIQHRPLVLLCGKHKTQLGGQQTRRLFREKQQPPPLTPRLGDLSEAELESGALDPSAILTP